MRMHDAQKDAMRNFGEEWALKEHRRFHHRPFDSPAELGPGNAADASHRPIENVTGQAA